MENSRALVDFKKNKSRMTSRELAQVLDTPHRNLRRSIRRLMKVGLLHPEQTHFLDPQNGGSYPQYELTADEAMLVMVGRSPEKRTKVMQRWLELEHTVHQPAPPPIAPQTSLTLPGDYLSALRALVASEESKLSLTAENQRLLPAAAVAERIADAKGEHDLLAAAKILGMGRQTLVQRLRRMCIFIPTAPLPYQRFIDADCFRVVENLWTTPDGVDHTWAKTYVTPKGLVWLAKKMNEETRNDRTASA